MPARLFFITLFLLPAFYSNSQDKIAQEDKRRLARIHSYYTELDVFDGKISLYYPYSGLTYYSLDMSKGWFTNQENNFQNYPHEYHKPHIYRLGNGVGIVLGQEVGSGRANLIIRTTDRGKTWATVFRLGKEERSPDVTYTNRKNSIWLTGKPGSLLASLDTGRTWTIHNIPFQEEPASLDFLNDMEAILAGPLFTLYTTSDGGLSWKLISDNFGNLAKTTTGRNDRISKVSVTPLYYMALSDDKLYYTARKKTRWKVLERITDFSVDNVSGNVYLLKKGDFIQCLDRNMRLSWSSPKRLPVSLPEIAGKGDTLFYYDTDTGKAGWVSKNDIFCDLVYSLSEDIEPPYYKVKVGQEQWGMHDQDILRYSAVSNQWHRMTVVPFRPWDIEAHNDSSFLITDLAKENQYYFNTNTRTYSRVAPLKPLSDFLRKPLRSFSIEFSKGGCFHFESTKIDYSGKEHEDFETDGASSQREFFGGDYDPDTSVGISKKLSRDDVMHFLVTLNQDFWNQPRLKDFNINDSTINAYAGILAALKDRTNGNGDRDADILVEGYRHYGLNSNRTDFRFYEIERVLSALNDSTIIKAFERPHGFSTSWLRYTVIFTNTANESIRFEHRESDRDILGESWFAPWTLTIGNQYFTTHNIGMTRFIHRAAPKNFILSEASLNALLLLKTGNMLSHEEIPDGK